MDCFELILNSPIDSENQALSMRYFGGEDVFFSVKSSGNEQNVAIPRYVLSKFMELVNYG